MRRRKFQNEKGGSRRRTIRRAGLSRARPTIPAQPPRQYAAQPEYCTTSAPKNPTHWQRKIVFVSEYLSERDALLRYG
jgi:hypothetical protein